MTTNTAQRRSPVLLFAALSLLTMSLVAGLFGVGALLEIARLARVPSWPVVEGTITASAASPGCGGNATFTPRVEYRYFVDGIAYEGKRRDLGMAVCDTEAHAGAIAQRYPVGSRVAVHVDPSHPERAVLETAIDTTALWVMATIALVVSGTGLYWVLPRTRILMRGSGGTQG